MDQRFGGFPKATFVFLERVQADLPWAVVNQWKDEWERAVHQPMELLLEELRGEFGDGYTYHLHKDPWLWRHHLGVVPVSDTIFLRAELSVEGLRIEGGWAPSSSDQVSRYRDALQQPTDTQMRSVIDRLTANGFSIEGRRVSRPRDFPLEHPDLDLARHRTIIASRPIDPHHIAGPPCVGAVREGWRQLRPLTSWLAEHVGPRDHH